MTLVFSTLSLCFSVASLVYVLRVERRLKRRADEAIVDSYRSSEAFFAMINCLRTSDV